MNLISISSLTTDLGSKVFFDTSTCEIQDPIRELTIGRGRRIANLYMMDTKTPSVLINEIVDIGVWHKRLGHLSLSLSFRCYL